jgi:cytoskeletal protein CcmA (bactofilin family)
VLAAESDVPPEPPHVEPPEDAHTTQGRPFHVAAGETNVGDVYRFATTVDIVGTQKGDLTVWAQSVSIPGTVTGDLYAAAQSVEISGTVGDSARIAASSVVVRGTIQGDLSIWAANTTLTKDSHVTGDVHCFSARCQIDGQVDGELHATGGQVGFGGKVAGDASIKCDVLEVQDGAHIAGDLDYETRERISLDGKDIVAGTIVFEEKKDKEEGEGDDGVAGWRVALWFWLLVAATIIGLLTLRLFPGPSRAITDSVSHDMLRSSGVGFLAVIVAPVALCILCILIITIPLVVVLFLLYGLTLYFTQFPVALWLGRKVLALFRKTDPSPYLSLVLGLLVLYLLFAIPCVGWLVRFYVVFLGFGAILLGLRSYRLQRKAASGGGPLPVSPEPAPAAP